ncbi:alpha/beta-hydrolase [Acaromyces ingoldii]|uniref:Alpha/beta-hydrolase n=1 Tax=Acaromyces ingoldii TaxID=215250 RepID=A0A316YC28_9BASI|nr:alpha/beta-hydrolase [Acaromyces ingoldii]PWN86781.1 alpha/beta-hydrolase [Acaromyces ingoldii]
MAGAITCPNGVQGKPGGVVLLVHGTTLTGKITYSESPFITQLPSAGPGFDVCWIDLPNQSMSDAQVSGEYVAYNIIQLSKKSATGKVKVVGHSQGGGLNIPHALLFWPSARNVVDDFVGLAPDFQGIKLTLYAICAAEDALSLGEGCAPSLIQQNADSNFIAAQNLLLTHALVPTTVVYTELFDEFLLGNDPLAAAILPVGPETSALNGSAQFPLQSQDVCGPSHAVEHILLPFDQAAYAIAEQAFTSSGTADITKFDKSSCQQNNLGAPVAEIQNVVTVAFELVTADGTNSRSEPPLKQCEKPKTYLRVDSLADQTTHLSHQDVCDAGAATNCA